MVNDLRQTKAFEIPWDRDGVVSDYIFSRKFGLESYKNSSVSLSHFIFPARVGKQEEH